MTDTAQDLRSALEPCPDCGGTTDTCMGAVIHADRCPVIAAWNRRALAAPATDEPVGLREALEAARDVVQMVEMFDKGTPLLTFVGQKQVERASALIGKALATPARTDDAAQAGGEGKA